MNKSESIKELTMALSKAQGEMHNPANTAINPFFKSKYAPLSEVINTVRPILSKYGLSFFQDDYGTGESITVTTTIFHSSGEWLQSGELTGKPEKNTVQAMGAVITYLRRYQLSSVLGLSSEDDTDGNESGKTETNNGKTKVESKEELITPEQVKAVHTLITKTKTDPEKIKEYYKVNSSKELTKKQATELIDRLSKKVEETKELNAPEGTGEVDSGGNPIK